MAMKPEDTFPEPQWQALLALLDATVPSIQVVDSLPPGDNHLCISQEQFNTSYDDIQRAMKHPPSREAFQKYLATRPSDNPMFIKLVKKTIGALPQGPKLQLYRVLSLMMTRLRSLISTGYSTPFHRQSVTVREAILRSWKHSWFFVWPSLARTFIQLGTLAWGPSDQIFQGLTGYKTYVTEVYRSVPASAIDFNFIKLDSVTAEPIELETDIIIVGSGCGGGVCAKVLAEAGHRVLIVDKGYYTPPSEFPIKPDSMKLLFDNGGVLSNTDGSIVIGAGSCWGGGGIINWSVSLPLLDFVRKEWADVHGLKFFNSSDLRDSFDRVSNFLGLLKDPEHSHANRVLLEGSKKLGWRAKTCPTNTITGHKCGSVCANGCRESNKQSPAVSWLPAAVKAGAQCIEGFEVSEVLFEEGRDGLKKATGISGKWTPREEDGSIGDTPKPESRRLNPNIGKNLHLHPCCPVIALFDKDPPGWEGQIITSAVTEFENLDGKGHGPRIEPMATSIVPAMWQIPWHDGLQFKTDALKHRQMNAFMSHNRDRDSGSVTADPNDGSPIVAYTASAFDRANTVVGMVGIAKLCYIQGASEIPPMVHNLARFRTNKPIGDRRIDDAGFADWLAGLQAADLNPSSAVFASAHQMSSYRMSTSPATGVVDEHGKVWGTEALYIADASVFPSASGDNPMITIMAIADYIARGISRHM
ncbi:long-chain fatty alcohol dehydrogenase [Hypoxylon crocopeplum]|nr:long-chain fatty alcohol dehydrogenase [Hypoxylon crocopeplum]